MKRFKSIGAALRTARKFHKEFGTRSYSYKCERDPFDTTLFTVAVHGRTVTGKQVFLTLV
jgi:hypothetical protein